jgi:hypothetical protein
MVELVSDAGYNNNNADRVSNPEMISIGITGLTYAAQRPPTAHRVFRLH